VPLSTPLNQRQLEVLEWIRAGCPHGRWSDSRYKTVAIALQSRRLIAISRRSGAWSAAALPAGLHYLTHGDYPPDHWTSRTRRSQTVNLDTAPCPQPTRSSPKPPRPPAPRPPDGLTPTRKLLKDIIDAGGILELDTRDDKTSYRSLVGIINRRGMAPDGQEVIMLSGRSYHHLVFRLSSVSDWKTISPAQTAAAERIGRWHPAVATLRTEKRLDSIDKPLRDRAFRLLHALAREAEAREHTVRLPKRSVHGYIEDPSKLRGDLIVKVGDIECSVDVSQPTDRLPHVPTPKELERQRQYSWDRPPRYDYVPSDRLSITLDTHSRWSSKVSWLDTKTLRMESRLPDVMTTFERWAVIDVERQEAERRAEIDKRERQAREDELARAAYVQHSLGLRLAADMEAWEVNGRLRRYVAVLRERVDSMTDATERATASEWLDWCDRFVTDHDPSAKSIAMPTVKPPGYSELAEFRKQLGFGGYW
jgi:hypothetical protein